MKGEEALWEKVEEDAAAHRRTDFLFAAVKLRLFDLIRAQPMALQQAAAVLGTAERRTRAFLDLAVAYGYLVREKGAYRQHPDLLPLTDAAREDNLQRRFAYPAHTRGSWALIPEALHEDRSVRTFDGLVDRSREVVEACHVSLGARGYLYMAELAEQVTMPVGARILDLGGGFGDLCRPFLERDPEATAVVYEASDTVALAEHHHAELAVGSRFEVVAGDFVTDDIPRGFDLVLLSAVLQFYDPDTVLHTLSKLAGCLNPSGAIMVREIHIAEDRSGPISGLEFDLHMALNSNHGRAYAPETMVRLLHRAGCSLVCRLVEGGLYYVLLGRLPA